VLEIKPQFPKLQKPLRHMVWTIDQLHFLFDTVLSIVNDWQQNCNAF